MYFSLNKKIFYTIFILSIFIAILFLTIFSSIYNKKHEQDFASVMRRNQYIMELLNENIALRRELKVAKINISDKNLQLLTQDLSAKQKELSREKKLNFELQQNYEERNMAFIDGMKIIGISSFLSLISIVILGFLLQKWVIWPIHKLTQISNLVSKSDFSHRIPLDKKQVFFDEFDTLTKTFNTMIDNIEDNIAEIKKVEKFLQSLIDAIPDGIRVFDQNHNIVLMNKAYIKLMKLTKPENCLKCFHAYNFDKPCPEGTFTCPLKEIKSSSMHSIRIIQNLVGKPLSINAAPLKIRDSQNKNDFYIIESIRDLSDDIRFSHEQKIASLGFLATSVAHEMKNNLGAVRMILEGLLSGPYKNISDEDEIKKYLQMIYNQIIASINTPERLLKLARNNDKEKDTFDINPSISEILSLLDYEAKRNGISVTQHSHHSKNLIIGNEADFKMIVLNLAQNALKAMPSGGELMIRTSNDKNFVTMEVIDTGMGISPDKLCHIFEPFYSDGRHSRQQGTGLGLAIVKSLVEKFKGIINVSSKINQGTQFIIKFPKVKRNKLQN